MINFIDLIKDSSMLNTDTQVELKEIVDKYPFFQVARLLYVSNLYQEHSQDFGIELRKAASFVPDRTALFALTEGVNYEMFPSNNDVNIEIENEGTRTMSLINRFLSGGSIETGEDDRSRKESPSITDLTNDYASYLMQKDAEFENDEMGVQELIPRLKGSDLIDHFIEETKGKQRFDMPDIDENEFVSPEFSDEEEVIYTENMVNIYIKQGRYQQALEILRKISLNNPKKSSNFASQIYLLEVLLNEKQ